MKRLHCAAAMVRQRLREYATFDSRVIGGVLTLLGFAAAFVSRVAGNRLRALSILCGIHRAAWTTSSTTWIVFADEQPARIAPWTDTPH